MIREVKFESQDRREKQILAALNANPRSLSDLRGDPAYLF